MPFKSSYHIRKFKKCKYCDNEAKRQILADGRNKGHYRTCGSVVCLTQQYKNPEVNDKKRHTGENHPFWIEDRSQVKFRPRYELTKWTMAVFVRDEYTCQYCNVKGGKLQAHHIKSYALYPSLRWDLNNGITLCLNCHKKTDSYARNVTKKGGNYAIS